MLPACDSAACGVWRRGVLTLVAHGALEHGVAGHAETGGKLQEVS